MENKGFQLWERLEKQVFSEPRRLSKTFLEVGAAVTRNHGTKINGKITEVVN